MVLFICIVSVSMGEMQTSNPLGWRRYKLQISWIFSFSLWLIDILFISGWLSLFFTILWKPLNHPQGSTLLMHATPSTLFVPTLDHDCVISCLLNHVIHNQNFPELHELLWQKGIQLASRHELPPEPSSSRFITNQPSPSTISWGHYTILIAGPKAMAFLQRGGEVGMLSQLCIQTAGSHLVTAGRWELSDWQRSYDSGSTATGMWFMAVNGYKTSQKCQPFLSHTIKRIPKATKY